MAAQYLPQITDLLNRVNREMLLIFKTNDLVRGIEYSYGVETGAGYFLTMTRCCVRAVYGWKHRLCDSFWCRFSVTCSKHLTLFRINVFEVYLWWRNSVLGLWLTNMFHVQQSINGVQHVFFCTRVVACAKKLFESESNFVTEFTNILHYNCKCDKCNCKPKMCKL